MARFKLSNIPIGKVESFNHLQPKDEHQYQVMFHNWFQQAYPDIWGFAIPNGAKLPYTKKKLPSGKTITISPQRQQLIDEGMTSGVADYQIMQAASGWNGLFIEFKFGYNKQSEEQVKFQKDCKEKNYLYILNKPTKSANPLEEIQKIVNDYMNNRYGA